MACRRILLASVFVIVTLPLVADSCRPPESTREEKEAGPPSAAPAPAVTPPAEPVTEDAGVPDACPDGMALVEGDYCFDLRHECLKSFVDDKERGTNPDWLNHCFRFREARATCLDRPRSLTYVLRNGRVEHSEVEATSPLGRTLMGRRLGGHLDGLLNGCRITALTNPLAGGSAGVGSSVTLTCPPTVHLRFCIDRFEHPDRVGEMPDRHVSFWQAREACQAAGKRLCYEHEWTLACEGNERRPYPYGWHRDNAACNTSRCFVHCGGEPEAEAKIRGFCRQYDDADGRVVERPFCPAVPMSILDGHNQPSRAEVDAAIDRLEHATGQPGVTFTRPSGTLPQCVSPFGVYDLTGNVDEWTQCLDNCVAYQSNLKGGHYLANVRNRCRPVTVDHDEPFVMPTVGFRCCADVK